MKRTGLALVGLVAWMTASIPALAGKPIVAVFSIEDRTGRLSASQVQQITDYLASKIAEGGIFRVIPGSQLKQRLVEQKKESYKDCYDQQCQIEIGRELAANKTLATQMMKLGDQCVVISTLFDLRTAATDASASQESRCLNNDLIRAVVKVTDKLKAQFSAGHATRGVRTPDASRPRPTDMGTLAVRSDPPGAAVYVDGELRGKAPTEIKVAPGRHTLQLRKADRKPRSTLVQVQSGQVLVVSLGLEPTAAAAGGVTGTTSVEQDRSTVEAPDMEVSQQVERQSALRRSKSIRGYVALGVGIACGVTAAILYGVARSQGDEAHDTYMAVDRVEDLDQAWSDVEPANTKIIASYVLMGTAGVALGYSLYELLTRPSATRVARTGPRVGLLTVTDGAGLAVGGRF